MLQFGPEYPIRAASAVFAPCAGSTFMFPNDDKANTGGLQRNMISCRVSASYEPSARQKAEQGPGSEPLG